MVEALKRPLRFSIRTILVWTVLIAAMFAAYMNLWRTNQRLRDAYGEIDRLSGQLELGRGYRPSDNVAVKKISLGNDAICWSWQLGIPSGRSYTLYRAQEGIPPEGFPRGLSTGDADAGLQRLTVGFGRVGKPPDRPWGLFHVIHREHGSSGGGGFVTDPVARREKLAWLLDEQTDWTVEQFGGEGEFQKSDSKQIVLLRVRAKKQSEDGRWIEDPEPCRGLMVWLAEQ